MTIKHKQYDTCLLCGELQPEANLVLAPTFRYGGGEFAPFVCGKCIAAGAQGAAQRMRNHAENLRQTAEHLDKLANGVEKMPVWGSAEALRQVSYLVMRFAK